MTRRTVLRRAVYVSAALVGVVTILFVAVPTYAAFPGRNGRIAFSSTPYAPSGSPAEIWLMNADGTNRVQLTGQGSSYQGSNVTAAWAADGSKIAFMSNRNQHADIFTTWSDGSHLMEVTHNTSPASDQSADTNPAWSPDGKKIIFERYDNALYGDVHHLFVVNADGSNLTDISKTTPDYPDDREPAWSPDGRTIACTCSGDIVLRNPDGSHPVPLNNEGVSPSWSPDGKKIAYIVQNSGNPVLWTMNRDGTDQKQLMAGNFLTPRWSPDGSLIVLTERNQAKYRLDTIRPDGSHLTPITSFNDPTTNYQPDWQPIVSSRASPGPAQSATANGASASHATSASPSAVRNSHTSPTPTPTGTATPSPSPTGSAEAAPFSGNATAKGSGHRHGIWPYVAGGVLGAGGIGAGVFFLLKRRASSRVLR